MQIICPMCGAPNGIAEAPSKPDKAFVTCRACKERTPYLRWRQAGAPVPPKPKPVQTEPITEYGGGLGVKREAVRDQVAFLKMLAPVAKRYELKPGKNVIGRYSPASSADIQIDTADNKRMSREHAVIEVKEVSGKYMYKFSLCKARINRTVVGGQEIAYGDSLYLKPGDILELPDAALVFDVQDPEGTVF